MRKASATGGRMLNPSVEPTARRESAQAKRDSRRNSAERRRSAGNSPALSPAAMASTAAGRLQGVSSAAALDEGNQSTASSIAAAAAEEARNQRRSIGLKVRLVGEFHPWHGRRTRRKALQHV